MTAVEELRDSLRFLGVENVEEDVLSSMIEAAAALGMKPSEMGDSWTAHSLNHSNVALSFENWMTFRTELNRSMASRLNRKRTSAAIVASPVVSSPAVNKSAPFTPKTPLAPIHPSLFEKQDIADMVSPMSQDPAAVGTTVFQYTLAGLANDSPAVAIDENWWGSGDEPPTASFQNLNPAPSPFRYMLQKPSEIVLALNDHLEQLEREAFSGDSDDKGAKDGAESQAVTETTRLVGRLVLPCLQNEATEGNGSGVSLQGSLEVTAGVETPLHVMPGAMTGFSVCQGQVVGASGTFAQTAKRLFMVEKILLPALPPVYTSSSKTAENDFLALIASGPFCGSGPKQAEDLNVKGLASVFQRFQPNVVILMGPYGTKTPPGALCRDLGRMTSKPTLFVLVPSHTDAASESPPVFPTLALQKFTSLVTQSNSTAISASDPGMFDVNGAMICVTAVDVLRHLATSELHLGSTGGGGGDRLAKLARTLVYQRSMYPLYPQAQSLPVDWPLWRKMTTLHHLPSLVILPSDLNPFIAPFSPNADKPVGPLLVNPGRVSRRRAALVRWSGKDQSFTAGRIVRV